MFTRMRRERQACAFAIVGRGAACGGIIVGFDGALAGVDGAAEFVSLYGADSFAGDGHFCGVVGGTSASIAT